MNKDCDTFAGGDQITNNLWIMEKAREFQKNICFTEYANAFDCVSKKAVENS